MPYEGSGSSSQMNGPPQAQQMPPHQMGGHYGYQGHRGPQQQQMGGGPPQGGGPMYNHNMQQGGNQQGMPPPAPAGGGNHHHRGSMPPMNMGGQYPGQQQMQAPPPPYANFNSQQGQTGQRHHQPYPPQQHHGYPPQHHMQQQQHGMPMMHQQQYAQQYNQQQYAQQQQQQYGRQNTSASSTQSSGQQQQQHQQAPPLSNSSQQSSSQQQQDSGPLNYTQPPNASTGSSGGDFGQEFLPAGLNGDWQSDNDMHLRREMIQHIVKLLKQKDKNASSEWLTKLPQMVKQLEVSLYRSAPSFEAYADTTNLKSRLQQLAMEIAKKTQKAKEGGGDGSESSQGHGPPGGNGSNHSHQQQPPYSHSQQNYNMSTSRGNDSVGGEVSNQHGNPNDPEWKVRIKHKQQRLLLLHHSSKCPYDDGQCKVTPYCGEMKKLWKHMARCTDNECRIPHCFSSRSILSHYRKCKDPRCPACGPVRETVRKTQKKNSNSPSDGHRSQPSDGGQWPTMDNGGGAYPMDNSSMNPPMQMNPQMSSMGQPMNNNGPMRSSQNMNGMQMQPSNAFPGRNSMPMGGPPPPQDQGRGSGHYSGSSEMNGSMDANNNFGNETDAKAKHKRQRLLLLRHASKCQAPPGQCKETPHCAEMKVLWKHIANCKESQCTVRHCMSSRYVLSHYRRCKGPCAICDPVRDAIDASKNGVNVDMSSDPAMTQSYTSPTGDAPLSKRPRTNVVSSSNPSQREAAPSSQSPKPSATEDNSLLESFTTEQVKTHLQSLKRHAKVAPAELKTKCMEVLKDLQTHEHGWVFASPVNPVELGLNDYFDIIKKPMDLGTIQKNLEAGSYHSFDDFKSDVRLTFENAMKYNEEKTVVHEMAKQLKKKFEQDYKKLMKAMDKEHAENSKKVQACGLCGGEKLLFEPPVFFCNGLNCQSTRIRRNHNFYLTADKQYAWCNQCYGELGDTIDLGTTQLKKADLTKRKNDETHEESWVQCDDCERWIHQICGLYNTRQDKENKSAYSCPQCVLDKRKKYGEPKTLPLPPCAEDLPRTKLSEWLEKAVHTKVEKRMKEIAREKAETENISYDAAYKSLSSGGPVTIRQVSSTDRKHEAREGMKARYAKKNYPDEFPYRCKCIVVFQNIDGVDVVLFALYVYEHGDDNPFPNKKTVYVSYLDSVHFLKPRKMRTTIYHEILISYLDYARAKGFEQAFIWACPPLKGDDYIFYAKPEDQKTPKDVRLRQWYIEMLVESQKRNIVGKVTNMYDQYFADKSLDASCVPYFEGDYFPGEAENIIKELNESGEKASASGGKKKSASKSKKSSKSKSPKDMVYSGGTDVVMQKFCEAIQGMKDSFIVAFLNCKDAKPENLVVPKKIIEYRQANGIIPDTLEDTKVDAEKAASQSDVAAESKEGGEGKSEAKEDESGSAVDDKSGQSKAEGATEEEKKEDAGPSAQAVLEDKKTDVGSSTEAVAEEKKADEDMTVPESDDKADSAAETSSDEKKADEDMTVPESDDKADSAAETSSDEKKADEEMTAPENDDKAANAVETSSDEKKADEEMTAPEGDDKAVNAVETSSDEKKADEEMAEKGDAGEVNATPDVNVSDVKPQAATADAIEAPGSEPEIKKVEEASGKKPDPVASVSDDRSPPAEEKLPTSRKRDADGNAVVPSETTSSSSGKVLDRNGKPIRIIDDDAEELDCEFFDTRQCFLDLCRGNHYQFDELRRAKHTSMMVLWHLQNREAPKFVQQCFACAREIASGYRHHCNTCPDFDLCTECYRDPNANRGQCTHKLEAIRVDNQGASSSLTEEQRRERQRNINLHITLIEHAARCKSTTCKSSNCQKMKSYLKHSLVCTVKASGGCKLCKRIWTLLRIHANACKSNTCPIPQCNAIRKRIRQLRLKQQAMDDRRRQEMNRHYRAGMMSGN